MFKKILQVAFLFFLWSPYLKSGVGMAPESSRDTAANTDQVQSLLTIYKNAALVRKTFKLPLEAGRRLYTLSGISASLFPLSLKLDVRSALKKAAHIEEYSLKSSEHGGNEKKLEITIYAKQNDPDNHLELQYFFKELGWKAEYAIQLASTYDELELNSWIELINQSPIDYNNTQIILIDSEESSLIREDSYSLTGTLTSNDPVYKIPHPINLPGKSTKKINWVSSTNIHIQQQYKLHVGKEFLVDLSGKVAKPPIEIWVSFSNDTQEGLGAPLPAGKAIVYYQRLKDNPEVLGFVNIPHTPINQMVNLRLPVSANHKQMTVEGSPVNSFISINTELEQTEFKKLTDKITEANYRLCLKNTSYQIATVQVILDLPSGNCKIVKENKLHQVESPKQFLWSIEIPAQSEVELKYRLRIDQNE